jgi:hypothetical protein
MSQSTDQSFPEFWARWTLATMVGWVLGFVLAIVLSELVVNLVYPKETNLIVGICLGASVSYCQRFAVRRWLRLGHDYVWGATIGIGIPFVAIVVLTEIGHEPGTLLATGLLGGGALTAGVLQLPALRRHARRVGWWVLATTVLWTAAWIVSRWPSGLALIAATFLHGAGSGATLLWLFRGRTPGGPSGRVSPLP